MLVTFTSFNGQGMLRYHMSNGKHKEIHPGSIGKRVISAQLLAAGLAGQASKGGQEQLRRSKRQRESHRRDDSSEPAAHQNASKKQRREKDEAHLQPCRALEEHPHWAEIEQAQITRVRDGQPMTFQKLKLSEAAREEFGERQYSLLQAVSFARCITCEKITVNIASGVKHRCKPKDRPHQPLQRKQETGPVLRGDMQLNTAVLAQVRMREHESQLHTYSCSAQIG